MGLTIFDMITAKEIAAYWQGLAQDKMPTLGEVLFPADKQLGLQLSWIKGSQGLPVSLAPATFDAVAPIRERIGVSKIEAEMAFFRERMTINEKERQFLLMAASASNSGMLMPLIKKVYDDVGGLVDGVGVAAERMRMQLLSTGKISITDRRGAYDYDYQFKAANKVELTTKLWSDPAASNPVKDIVGWQEQIYEETGNRPNRAICSRKTWGYLLDNQSIRKDMNLEKGQNIIMTDSMLQQYFATKLQLSISVYNKKYKVTLDGAAQQYFPDNVFTLIPSGTLGKTYFGTTPEEADLMSDASQAQVQIVDTGVAVTTHKIIHPVNVETIVSAICLPSFEAANSVLIAKVA